MSSTESQDIFENCEVNEDDEEGEEDEDDPFSMAFKELSETNRLADEITRVRNRSAVMRDVPLFPRSQQRTVQSPSPPPPPPPPAPISIPRPIILHGLRPPAPSPPIIRLQRPIIIPSPMISSYRPPNVFRLPTPNEPTFPTKLPNAEEEDDDEEQSAQTADTYLDYMPLKRRFFVFRRPFDAFVFSSIGRSASGSGRGNVVVGFGGAARHHLSTDHSEREDPGERSFRLTIGNDRLRVATAQHVSARRHARGFSHR